MFLQHGIDGDCRPCYSKSQRTLSQIEGCGRYPPWDDGRSKRCGGCVGRAQREKSLTLPSRLRRQWASPRRSCRRLPSLPPPASASHRQRRGPLPAGGVNERCRTHARVDSCRLLGVHRVSFARTAGRPVCTSEHAPEQLRPVTASTSKYQSRPVPSELTLDAATGALDPVSSWRHGDHVPPSKRYECH